MKSWIKKKYLIARQKYPFKQLIERWTKIHEERRKELFSFFHDSFNYLQNSLLLSIPISLVFSKPYIKTVICVWIALPFIEHYYVWFRENWKDDLIE